MRDAQTVVRRLVLLWLITALDDMAPLDGAGVTGRLGRLAGTMRNRMLDVVGPDEIVERLDVNALIERVDIDTLLARVDIERVVQRAGIPDIIAESTGSVAESALDLLRRQLLALDVVLMRGVMRIMNRDEASLPAGPASLAGDGGPAHSMPEPNAPVTDVTGHYAGAITRLAAHALDTAIAGAVFTVASGALLWAWRAVGGPIAHAAPIDPEP